MSKPTTSSSTLPSYLSLLTPKKLPDYEANCASQDLHNALSRVDDVEARECLQRNLQELGYIR